MAATSHSIPTTRAGTIDQFDAIIIGAGVSGLCQLYHLRQLGLKVRLFEEGDESVPEGLC
jgi:acetone monooxygenase (methyl acetate-forming)